jgi:hypothetical protein
MFEEDPFSLWCLALVSELQRVVRVGCIYGVYLVEVIREHIRHLARILLIHVYYGCRRVFGTSFGITLKTHSWAEVEQMRRRLIRETGVFYPRSRQLEDGLQQEQEEAVAAEESRGQEQDETS